MLFKTSVVAYLINKFDLAGKPGEVFVWVGCVLLCMAISYVLGSLNFGVILSSLKYKDDIRTHGSGNAGTTNMLRTYGKGAAAATLIGDMLKAVVAMIAGYALLPSQVQIGVDADGLPIIAAPMYGAAIAGLFVVVGHIFPCFFHFKGGKGVASTLMVILMTNPIVFGIVILIHGIIMFSTKFVSLAAIMAMVLYPIILSSIETAIFGQPGLASATAVVLAVLVVFAHRENIQRLRAGNESKLSFKKKNKDASDK